MQILDEVYYIQEVFNDNPCDDRIAIIYPKEFYGDSVLNKNILKMLSAIREYINESNLYKLYKNKIELARWDSQKIEYANNALKHQIKVEELSKIMDDGISPYTWCVEKINDELVFDGHSHRIDYLVSLEKLW